VAAQYRLSFIYFFVFLRGQHVLGQGRKHVTQAKPHLTRSSSYMAADSASTEPMETDVNILGKFPSVSKGWSQFQY
jgi:hypothetical protein